MVGNFQAQYYEEPPGLPQYLEPMQYMELTQGLVLSEYVFESLNYVSNYMDAFLRLPWEANILI